MRYVFAHWTLDIEPSCALPDGVIDPYLRFRTSRSASHSFSFTPAQADRRAEGWPLVFAGKHWQLRQHGQQRCFIFVNPKSSAYHHFIYLAEDERHGHIDYSDPDRSLGLFPFFQRPLKFLLTHLLALEGGLFLHATAVRYRQQAYLFSGMSEAGKSTLARLWMAVPGAEVLSDERIILCRHQGEIWAYGTPWYSSARQSSPFGAPLGHIFTIRHALQNEIVPLKPIEAYALLFKNTYAAVWDRARLNANLDLLQEIVNQVPCSDFGFVPNPSAIERLLCHLA